MLLCWADLDGCAREGGGANGCWLVWAVREGGGAKLWGRGGVAVREAGGAKGCSGGAGAEGAEGAPPKLADRRAAMAWAAATACRNPAQQLLVALPV